MKGGWLLRKSWKIYQKTYLQLYEMYTNGSTEYDEKLLRKFLFSDKWLVVSTNFVISPLSKTAKLFQKTSNIEFDVLF